MRAKILPCLGFAAGTTGGQGRGCGSGAGCGGAWSVCGFEGRLDAAVKNRLRKRFRFAHQ